jgi:hypothetical protein
MITALWEYPIHSVHANTFCDPNSDSHTDDNGHAYGDTHGYSDGYCNSNAYGYSELHAKPESYAEVCTHSETSPDARTASVVKRCNPLRSRLKGTGVNDSGYSLPVPSAFARFISLIFRCNVRWLMPSFFAALNNYAV